MRHVVVCSIFLALLCLPHITPAEGVLPIYGRVEYGLGAYIDSAAAFADALIMNEAAIQIGLSKTSEKAGFNLMLAARRDEIRDTTGSDLREATITLFPSERLELTVGRQRLAWGIGAHMLINDLFPKDWNVFFIGRSDDDFLVPVTAARLTLFSDVGELTAVVTPRFTPDRQPELIRIAQKDEVIILGGIDPPRKPEYHLRFARKIYWVETALYAYKGFDKEASASFAELAVYGASLRTPLPADSVFHLEGGYYDSQTQPSRLKILTGIDRPVLNRLNLGLRYAFESESSGYGVERDWLTFRLAARDRWHGIMWSTYGGYSPSNQQWMFCPDVTLLFTEELRISAGARFFKGNQMNRSFGIWHEQQNVYVRVQYIF